MKIIYDKAPEPVLRFEDLEEGQWFWVPLFDKPTEPLPRVKIGNRYVCFHKHDNVHEVVEGGKNLDGLEVRCLNVKMLVNI